MLMLRRQLLNTEGITGTIIITAIVITGITGLWSMYPLRRHRRRHRRIHK
jgi:hypothetical protein